MNIETVFEGLSEQDRNEILSQIKVKADRRKRLTGWHKEGKYLNQTEYQKYAQQAKRSGMDATEYLIRLGYTLIPKKGRPKVKVN